MADRFYRTKEDADELSRLRAENERLKEERDNADIALQWISVELGGTDEWPDQYSMIADVKELASLLSARVKALEQTNEVLLKAGKATGEQLCEAQQHCFDVTAERNELLIQIDRLEEALRPFAEVAQYMTTPRGGDPAIWSQMHQTAGAVEGRRHIEVLRSDFRRAARAMEGKDDG